MIVDRIQLVAFSLLLVAIVIWASTFLVIKDTVSELNPWFIVFGRTFISSFLMFFIILYRRGNLVFNKALVFNGLIVGILLGIGFQTQTIGLKYTNSGHSAFISCAGVIFVPLILFIFFKERISRVNIFSIIITVTGLFLLTYDFKTRINYGDLITSISMVTLSINVVYQSKFVKKVEVLPFLFFQFLGALLFSLFGLVDRSGYILQISLKSILVLIYLGVFPTLFCISVMTWSLKYLHPFQIALLISLEPAFAAIFAYYLFGETLNPKELIGIFTLLIGIIYFQQQQYRLSKSINK